jgi:hypothetical protein
MPSRYRVSIHINGVLIIVAVDSGEQNSHKKVASRCVVPNVWYRTCGAERVVPNVWYRLSFLFLESAIKGNIYLYLLELFAFPQIADINSETDAAVVFWRGGGPILFQSQDATCPECFVS